VARSSVLREFSSKKEFPPAEDGTTLLTTKSLKRSRRRVTFDVATKTSILRRRARRHATINVVDFSDVTRCQNMVDVSDVTTCQNIRKVSEHMYPDKNVM
jgi:hypothetical protein